MTLDLSKSLFFFPGPETDPQLTPQNNLVQPIHFADDEIEA